MVDDLRNDEAEHATAKSILSGVDRTRQFLIPDAQQLPLCDSLLRMCGRVDILHEQGIATPKDQDPKAASGDDQGKRPTDAGPVESETKTSKKGSGERQ